MSSFQQADCLVVAADFMPAADEGRWSVLEQVLKLADAIQDTGVYLKVNSSLRACGYDLIDEIHSRGLRVFADLKLCDITQTLRTDAAMLRKVSPEILTVMCTVGFSALHTLKADLPDTEVLGVTSLTSLSDLDTLIQFGCSVEDMVMRSMRAISEAMLDGVVCAPAEIKPIRMRYGSSFLIVTPNIRPQWSQVENDDQNLTRTMTPEEAIKAGADRIVIGRPITQAKDPREATLRTIEEITKACVS